MKIVLGLAVAALVAGGVVISRVGLPDVSLAAITEWANATGPAAWLALIGAQTLAAIAGIIPASLIGIAAGVVFGFWKGLGLATVGTLLGGWIAFLLARSLFRPTIERMIARRVGRRLRTLDAEVARDGWRFVALLRSSPVMPFAVTSYALGLTGISLRNYMIGTVAALPALAGYVGAGALARNGALTTAQPTGALHWLLLGFGAVATLLLVFYSGALLARCGLLPRAR